MSESSSFVMCSAPPFGERGCCSQATGGFTTTAYPLRVKGGQGGIHTPYLQAAVAESPLTPLFQRGEHFCRAIKA
jgi:hypothetical protein